MKITMMEMAELSYSEEYENWLRDTFIKFNNSEIKKAAVDRLLSFDEFLEEKGYELAI